MRWMQGKIMKKLAFVALILLFSLSDTAIAGRGQGGVVSNLKPVVIRDRSGKEVGLYQESYALLVGVSDYTHGWPDLPGVKEDIREVRSVLERNGFRAVVIENPNREETLRAFNDFINKYGLKTENRLLFYFAGHGHTIKQSYGEEMGYIVPADAPNPHRDRNGFLTKAIDMQQIEVYAKRIQSKHALFLFDSCFSGSIFSLSRAVPENISYKTSKPVRQFITSGSADEQVPDNSIFRQQFIAALDGEGDVDQDGYVTGSELGEFLQKKVINYSKGAQHPQYGKIRNPNLDKGDFVFVLETGSRKNKAKKRNQKLAAVWKSDNSEVEVYTPEPETGDAWQNSFGMKFVYIAPGSFIMGSSDTESGRDSDENQHRVTLTQGFYMQTTELTQRQWKVVMGENPPKLRFKDCGKDCPAERVSWYDVEKFIKKLNQLEGNDQYRLPTEAEWEYACRAESTTAYYSEYGKSRLGEYAWYDANSKSKTHPVGQKRPNKWGLYDMSGNVSEWCLDWKGAYPSGSVTDPNGLPVGSHRVFRGGSWLSRPKNVRSADRHRFMPDIRYYSVGFRLLKTQ